MANLTAEILSKAVGTPSEIKNSIQKAEAQFEDITLQAGQTLGQYASKALDRTNHYINNGKGYVRQHPTQGVIIAASAGLLAGYFLSSMIRKN